MEVRPVLRKLTLAVAPWLVLASVAVVRLGAQVPTYQWHTFYNPGETAFGGGSGKSVATDINGNVYVAGITHHPETFAPGSPVHGVEAAPSGNYVGFIMKLNSSGALLWHTFYHVTFAAIAVETDGASVYFTGNGQFRNDSLPAPRYNGVLSDIDQATFLLKLDAQGQYLWHTEFNRGDGGQDLAIDPSNHNIYITGSARVAMGGFPAAPLHQPSGPSAAPFILALTQEGSYLWHSIWGEGYARSVAVDGAGNIFLTGQWHDDSGQSVFVAKVGGPTSTVGFGTLAWIQLWGGNLEGLAVAADSAGNVYATGRARPTASHPGQPPMHTDGLSPSTFVVKFDPNGTCLWYTLYGGEGYGSEGRGIVLDGLGKVYVTGYKDNNAFLGDAGQPSLHDNTQVSGYNGGLFLLALNTNGAYQWHTFYGDRDRTYAHGIALDLNRNIYVAGGSRYPWLGDNGTQALFAHGGADAVFLIKLGQAAPAPTITATSNVPITYSAAAQNISLAATVTSASGTVDAGQVRFLLFGVPVYGPVIAGVASAGSVVPAGTTVGNYAIQADYQGSTGFAPSSDVKQLIISKATPVVTWSNPADITFGSALGAMQLNATASVPGTFVYSPPAGTVLPAGNAQTLSATFTPADTANCNSAAKSVPINVLPASAPGTPAKIVVTKTLRRNGSNQVVVDLWISNTGGTAAQTVQLTGGKIGATPGTPLPQALGTVAAGGTVTATLTFPGSVGPAGTPSTLTIAGAYTGGSFNSAGRITLP